MRYIAATNRDRRNMGGNNSIQLGRASVGFAIAAVFYTYCNATSMTLGGRGWCSGMAFTGRVAQLIEVNVVIASEDAHSIFMIG